MLSRDLYRHIWEELSETKSMVFIAGPRQSGKTTLARMISEDFANHVYFDWDLVTNKRLLISEPTFFEEMTRKDESVPLIIFDEIHKYRNWKNYLKGIYDHFAPRYKFLVLGSGQLNVFQKGGDSLSGRYFMFYLWPFTLAELANQRSPLREFFKDPSTVQTKHSTKLHTIWSKLEELSGFPEPYTSDRKSFYRRWSRTYAYQLIREDIRNMTEIKRIEDVEILYSLLSTRVGSPLSMDSLARDLQVSFHSVKHWLKIFESFFLTLTVAPWTRKISRAILKEKKLYLFDYASLLSPAVRFENMVAVELHRAVHTWTDLGLGTFSLHYIRNKEKEEVDFLIARDGTPLILVECKLAEEQVGKSVKKFQDIFRIPAVQLVNQKGVYRLLTNQGKKILVISAPLWLATLP